MGNWGSSSSSKVPDTAIFVGTWVELHVAKALENPGVMMIGSSSDFTSKWELVVTKSLSFVLKCTSGYDFRGQFSSSGIYDNKVALHKFTATGKMINIIVAKTKAQKFSKGSSLPIVAGREVFFSKNLIPPTTTFFQYGNTSEKK